MSSLRPWALPLATSIALTDVIAVDQQNSDKSVTLRKITVNDLLQMNDVLLASNNLSEVSNPATALENLGAASLFSPQFVGVPTAPTAPDNTSNTQVATTEFVQNALVAASLGDTATLNVTNSLTVTGTSTLTGPVGGAGFIAAAADAAPVQSVAGRTGNIVLTASDITNIGSIATQAANNVNITGGTITGVTIQLASLGGSVPASEVFAGPPTGADASPTFRRLSTTDVTEGTGLYFTNARASAAAPVQSVAGRTGVITLSPSDIIGLGTIATQASNNVNITGGTISGVSLTVPGLPSGGTARQVLAKIDSTDFNTQWVSEPYRPKLSYPGSPASSAFMVGDYIVDTVTFPANFAGSRFKCRTAPAGSYTIDVRKNGTSVGSIVFAGSATTATFSTVGGATVSVVDGDYIELFAPAGTDTIADIYGTLVGTR